MFSYNPLWKTLVDKNMNRTELAKRAKLTSQTITDMGKNKPVNMTTLNKICNVLQCNISDVIEHFPDDN